MPSAAGLTIPVVWSEECLRHEPGGEVWLGVRERGTELPERAEAILAALRTAGAAVVPAVAHDDEVLRAVHDDALIEHLRTVWAEWEARGYVSGHGRDRVLPYVFPTAGMLAGLPLRSPAATHARVGRFCYDTMTLVGPGSREAIRAAADAAQTAADLVAVGARAAYALCRPPGHHAGPGAYGGWCYLNNAAVAAEALRRTGAQRVAISTSTRTTATARRRFSTTAPTSTTAACTSIPALAGSRIMPATQPSGAAAQAREPTATCRWPREPATPDGWPHSTCYAPRPGAAASTRPSFRSGSTPPRPIRRARCR